MRRAFIVVLCLACAGALRAQGDKVPFNDSIRVADLKADLFFLAGDGFKGRLVGTPENALAAEFVRSRFERAGLAPGGASNTFIQPVNLMSATLGQENLLEILNPDGPAMRLRPEQDFYPQRFSASGHVRAPLVYAGFGITAPALSYDDYAGDRVKGRIALILEHEPGERDPASPFDGVVTAEAAVPIKKVLAAQERGAVGVLFVADVHNHPALNFQAQARAFWPKTPPRIERFTLASWADRVRIPVAQVSPALADILIRATGRSLADLSRAAETARGFEALPLGGVEVSLTTSVDRHIVPDRNVLGYIEGTDPRLKDEVVIISAHYDHEGSDGRVTFNGADDDGSGTVALIEIAEAYGLAAQANQRPRRSVLFACWGSEERGPLLGAWAYTEQPRWALEKTVAVLNMDMIGRNEEVPVGGGGRFTGLEVQTAESNRNAVNILGYTRTPDLSALVERTNKSYGLELKMRYDNNASNLLRRSDQWPFLQRGVPALWFHSGLHPDYHTQYDRPEKINYEKMEKIARLVHHASWVLANQEGRPRMATRPPTE